MTAASSPGVDSPLLTLDAALERARSRNLDLRVARERVARASILSKKAWGMIMPVLSASTSIARNDQEVAFSFGLPESLRPVFDAFGADFPEAGPPIVIQERVQQNAAIRVSWTLLNGRSFPLIQNAYDAVDVAQLSYKQFELVLLNAVTLSYFNVLTAQQQQQIRTRGLANSRDHLNLASAHREVGDSTDVEVLRAEVAVATAEQALLAANNTEQLAKLALADLIAAIDADGNVEAFSVSRPDDTAEASDTHTLISKAQTQRLDLKQRRLEVDIADRSNIEAWTQFLPVLTGTGVWQWSNAGGFTNDPTTWQVGLALRWTLFEGGRTYWELQEHVHRRREVRLELQSAASKVSRQVREAQLNLASAVTRHASSKRRADLARRSSDMVKAQYEVGAVTELEALEANRSVADAETAEAMSQLQVDAARQAVRMVLETAPVL